MPGLPLTARAAWSTNGKDYTHIKSVSKLTTTDKEKTALSSMLDTCSV
ncbi:hypothetical protein ACFY3M_51120 [Streptomyces mirabilis]